MALLDNIRNKVRNREAKSLFDNFTYMGIVQIAMYLFPLITAPYLSRVIGPEGYGALAKGSVMMVYFGLLINFGFDYSAARDIARVRDDIRRVSELVCTVLYTKLVLTAVTTALFALCMLTVPYFRDNWLVTLLYYINTVANSFYPQWFFQGIEQMKWAAILNFVSRLFFVVMIFFVVREQGDYLYCPILILCGIIVSSIASFRLMATRYHISHYLPSWGEIKAQLHHSKDIFISLFFPNLYHNLSIMLLAFWSSTAQMGIYEGGYKLVPLTESFQKLLSKVFYPLLSRKIEYHRIYAAIQVLSSLAIAVPLFFFADFLIVFFLGDQFADSALILKILCFFMFFSALIDAYGTNFLLLVGKEKTQRLIMIIASLLGMLIAFYCAYHYQAVGTAVSITISRGIVATMICLAVLHYKLQQTRGES